MNSEFKTKENEREKMYNKAYKLSNHEMVKDSQKKAQLAYKQSNPEKVKESQKKSKENLQAS